MSQTVHDLRNAIRTAVDRFERETATGFTKESLAAVASALGHEIPAGRLPPKAEMRAAIRERVGLVEEADPDSAGGSFRKAELEAILAALESE